MSTLAEVRSVALHGALRTCERAFAPISLSNGFVSRDPISYPPPYALRLRAEEPVRVARVTLGATSLPVTLTLVSDIGARSSIELAPGEEGELCVPAGASVPSNAPFAIEVSAITLVRSRWRFDDRVRFEAHFFGGGAAAASPPFVARQAPLVHDRLARPIIALAHPIDARVTIAYMHIDSNPLTLRRCQLTSEPLAAFGTMTADRGAFTSNSTVVQEDFVEGISPIAIDFAAAARRVERNEGVETCLRALGDLSDALGRALAGSGAPVANDDVNQSTFVQSHQGFVRAIAAATLPTVQPLVDATDAPPDALFPLVDGVRYIHAPSRTLRVRTPAINLLPPLGPDAFRLDAVLALAQLTMPVAPVERSPTTGVSIVRLSPERTLEPTVRLHTSGGVVAVRAPVGDASMANVALNLTEGEHTLQLAGFGLIPIEVVSSGAHGDAFVFRGRLGLVVPPIVGTIVGAATHVARVHVFHADLVPDGELRVRWMHQPASTVTRVVFPLDATTSSLVLARDEAIDLAVERRLGVPIAPYALARAVRSRTPTVGQRITLAFWLFVDADARLDTWRAPFRPGVVLRSTDRTWFTATLDATALTIASDLAADETVTLPIVRDRWIFVCVRPHARTVCVAHTGGFHERTVNAPLHGAHAELVVPALHGAHVRALTTWDAHLDDETVRTLCDARIGPRMRYDRVDLALEWLDAPISQVGVETRLLIDGPPASAFDVAHASLVWYHSRPPPPSLVDITMTTAGVTIALFSDSVVLAYAEGEGLVVLNVDRNRVTLLGHVERIPSGSFFSLEQVPLI